MLVNAFATPDLKGITYIPGRLCQYRADCKAGVFKIGESKFVGSTLAMEILSWRTFEDQLFDYPHQTWLEILFVDPRNVVSHILFKTQSLDNFLDFMLDLASQGKAIGQGVTTAKMSKRSGDLGIYYAVDFEWKESNKKRVTELQAFASEQDLYASRLADVRHLKNAEAQPLELPA
jgi:hypothetical protein